MRSSAAASSFGTPASVSTSSFRGVAPQPASARSSFAGVPAASARSTVAFVSSARFANASSIDSFTNAPPFPAAFSSVSSMLLQPFTPGSPPPSIPTVFPIAYVPPAPGTVPADPFTGLPVSVPPPSPLSGNGVLNGDEECDDGNLNDLDGCSAYGLVEFGSCGDGRVQQLLGEQCEPSLQNALPCLSNCRFLLTTCGDGRIDAGEACDQGALNANARDAQCRPDCSLARCGDVILSPAEECDDGNRLPGDRCDAFCRQERSGAIAQQQPGAVTLPASLVDIPQMMSGQPAAQRPLSGPLSANVTAVPATTSSGPEALAFMAAGAAAGYAWIRRRRG